MGQRRHQYVKLKLQQFSKAHRAPNSIQFVGSAFEQHHIEGGGDIGLHVLDIFLYALDGDEQL